MKVERKRGVGSPPIFCLDLPKRPGRQSERAGYEPVYYWPTSCNPNFDKTCAKFNFLKRDIFDISGASIFENNTLKNLPPRKEITMVYNKWVDTVYTWFILSYSYQIKTTKVGQKCGNKWKQAIHNLRQNKIGRVYRIDHHNKCIDFLLVLKRM